MQLVSTWHVPLSRRPLIAGGCALALCVVFPATARSDARASATTTVFREAGGPLDMTVITPSVNLSGDAGQAVTIRAGWEADIVSGASVRVVDNPSSEVDAITSATKLDDLRNTATGGVTLRSDLASLDLDYSYGHESDYRSHSFRIGGRAELFERNTGLDLAYARGFDRVCNLAQPRAQEAVDRQAMPTSSGCFDSDERESLDLSIQTFQGGWTQAWAPVFTTQTTVTVQLLDGYQGNPYRAVWLGRSAAQENHPNNRARYAAGLGTRLWIKPLAGALQTFGRLYRDTWDIQSLTAELAYEQRLGGSVRLRARARYYTQTGAAFFSDDYVRFPRGQFFTGDRELSPMSSWTFGGRAEWTPAPGDDGKIGFLRGLRLVGKFDVLIYSFDDFHYGQAAVPNDSAFVATLSLESTF